MTRRMSGVVTYGYSTGESESTSCALQAPPRASGPKFWVMVAKAPWKIEAALPSTMAERITPWPPKPARRISVSCIPSPLVQQISRPAIRGIVLSSWFDSRGARDPQICHDDFPGHGHAHFTGGRAVPDFALLFVILHGVESVAHLVPALIERGAGRYDL